MLLAAVFAGCGVRNNAALTVWKYKFVVENVYVLQRYECLTCITSA